MDVGAWTTDISFFRLTDVSLTTKGVRTLAFYSAKTYRIAADQIDEHLCDFLAEIWGVDQLLSSTDGNEDLASLIRVERERGTLESGNIHWKGEDRMVPSATIEVARLLTSSDVRRHFIQTQREAYLKEIPPQEPKWRAFPILVMGGGSEEKCLEDILRKNVPLRGPVKRLPLTPLAFGEAAGSKVSSISHRLAVSHGLSFPRALWPEFLSPSAVPPPGPEKTKRIEGRGDDPPG